MATLFLHCNEKHAPDVAPADPYSIVQQPLSIFLIIRYNAFFIARKT